MVVDKHNITIASTITKEYLLPLSVTVYSLLKNKRPGLRINWYVFESRIPDTDKAEFERLYYGTDITFYWISLAHIDLPSLPLWGRALPVMYQRLLIPDFFPAGIQKVLYLDADLLVLGNIEELFSESLGGKVIGAVQDMAIPTVSSPLGLSNYKTMNVSPKTPYFNAGLLLIDIPAWKKCCITEQTLSYLETTDHVAMMDQDALNAIMLNSWKPLHYRWNVIGSSAGRPFFNTQDLDKSQYDEAVRNPGIIHFGGYLKPWLIRGLGSKWDADYKHFLYSQGMRVAFDTTMKSTVYALYDRYFRSSFYPLERMVWRLLQYY
jgi:lipopolysaccharide biosynthesis glycosyltransferase